jgi:hypothetical protein
MINSYWLEYPNMVSISAQDNIQRLILNLINFYIIDNYYDK